MKKNKYEKKGFINCNCGAANFNQYMTQVFSLDMTIISVGDGGYLKEWVLYDEDGEYVRGRGVNDFVNLLHLLRLRYNLEIHSDSCRDKIIIYVDNVMKIMGFFKSHITDEFSTMSVTLLDNFEFRSYKLWNKEINAANAAYFMQKIANEMFVPEKYFYLTPNQRTRKLLAKECRKEKNDTAKELFPDTPASYALLREALFGGICFCPYPNVIVENPMLELDIKSAYIYIMLTKKFPIKRIENIDVKNYEYYLNNSYETSLGIYKIKYTTASNIVTCYKYYDSDGKAHHLQKGENIEVTLTLDSIDLNLLLNLPNVYILSVECKYLESYKMDYLPKYVCAKLIEEYIKKSQIDEDKNPELYKVQKVVLNGIYGNTIKKLEDLSKYNSKKSKAYLAPQWGIWTTSYTKELLLGLALKVEGWMYSDTDSIYCFDNIDNCSKIEAYNSQILRDIYDLCDRINANIESIRELGKFDVKHHIKKFKALCQKEYLYTTIEDEIIVKAAGCSKEQMKVDDDLYKANKLPVGTKTFGFIQEDYTEAIIDGEKCSSDGSYYEVVLNGEDAALAMYAIESIKGDDNDEY